jgi:hypothetical protein
MTTGTFAAAFVALYAAHMVGDHVLQTDRQARGKAADKGWAAPMAGHLATYLAAQFLALFAVAHIAPFPATNLGVACGLGFSAATHGLIDRRWPVRWLLEHTGSRDFARLTSNGLNGMYLCDQSLHIGCLFAAALIVGGLS